MLTRRQRAVLYMITCVCAVSMFLLWPSVLSAVTVLLSMVALGLGWSGPVSLRSPPPPPALTEPVQPPRVVNIGDASRTRVIGPELVEDPERVKILEQLTAVPIEAVIAAAEARAVATQSEWRVRQILTLDETLATLVPDDPERPFLAQQRNELAEQLRAMPGLETFVVSRYEYPGFHLPEGTANMIELTGPEDANLTFIRRPDDG